MTQLVPMLGGSAFAALLRQHLESIAA